MNRRTLLLGFATLSFVSVDLLASDEKGACAICKSKLTEAGKVKFTKNSVNLNFRLWLPENSLHGHYSPFYQDFRPFCLKCYFSYFVETKTWERSSIIRNSFYIPLDASFQNFPHHVTSTDNALYAQTFHGQNANEGRVELISFWSNYGDEHKNEIRKYCEVNSIECEISHESAERFHVRATKKIS